MFIAHGEKFRKNARWIMAGVLLLLIPGFVALFTTTSGRGDRGGRDGELPTIHGKPINAQDYERACNDVEAQYVINTGRNLTRTAAIEDEIKQRAVIQLLLQRKAAEFGLRVTDAELVQHLQRQPAFADQNGRFDPNRYRAFVMRLNNFGISEGRLEELLRQQLLVERLQTLVGSAAKATPAEVDLAYTAMCERLTIAVVEFNLTNFLSTVTVSNAEAQAYFAANQEKFRVPKKVQVRYARFAAADLKAAVKISTNEVAQFYERNQPKYTDDKGNPKALDAVKDEIEKELIGLRAEQMAGDRATELSVKVAPEPGAATNKADFAKVAADLGGTIAETGFFSATAPISAVTSNQMFRRVAFTLTPDAPYSDAVPGDDGYYVLQWRATRASHIPPFDQVKDEVIDRLKRQHAYELTVQRGQDALAKLKPAVASNTTFAVACAAAHLQPATFGPFTLADQNVELPAAQFIQEAALGMATNSVSEFIPTAQGGLFFHLQNRQPPETAKEDETKKRLTEQILQRNRQALFNDWLSAFVRDEQVNFGRMRSREAKPPPAPAEPSEEEPAPAPAPAKS